MKRILFILFSIIAFTFLFCGTIKKNENIKIGPYYAGVLNGISFVHSDQAAFLMRIGWVGPEGLYKDKLKDLLATIEKMDMASPDGSIHRLSWQSGETKIRLEWGQSSPYSVVGKVYADGPARIVLATNQAWDFKSIYQVKKQGIYGRARINGRSIQWRLEANRSPVSQFCTNESRNSLAGIIANNIDSSETEGENAALVFELDQDNPLEFVAGFDSLAHISQIDSVLRCAEKRYQKNRIQASGDWGDFIEPLTNNLNNNKVYNFKSHRIAHTVSRAWCKDDREGETTIDGQVLFAWDSFFNGLLASVEDPDGAKETIRAILAAQQENGLIPNMSGPRRWLTADRSQLPVGSMCVWKIYQRWPDKDFLAEVYPKLKRWHQWWFSIRPSNDLPYRDGNQNGLLEFGTETGFFLNAKYEALDDSPAFDFAQMNNETFTMELDAVGLNAMWAADAEYLSLMAEELGEKKEAVEFRQERKDMNKRMNDFLWNEKLGMYCDRYWTVDSRVNRKKGQSIPTEYLFTPSGQPGLKGDYFTGIYFDTLKTTRVDREINDFTVKSVKSIGDKYYSIRWTGFIKPKTTGEYIFALSCNDGARLWINGEQVINDDWIGHQKFVNISHPILIKADEKAKIKLEYFQGGGRSDLYFGWYQKESVPKDTNLFSNKLTSMNFCPLISRTPSEAQAKRILAVLKDPNKFWGEYVCPTISRDDPTFPEQQYWRGAIWAPTNYLLYLGLKNYAEPDLLNEFAEKSVTLFMNNWRAHGTCHENFLADGSGAKDPYYTWGALLCLIGLENVCDILPKGHIMLNGLLQKEITIKNVPILGKTFDVHIKNGHTELFQGEKRVMQASGSQIFK